MTATVVNLSASEVVNNPEAEIACSSDTLYSDISRPIFFTFTLKTGSSQISDSYLSPLKYSGASFGIAAQWEKAFTAVPRNWSQSFDFAVDGSYPYSQSKSSVMPRVQLGFEYGVRWRKYVIPNLSLSPGISAGFNAGMCYLSTNSNNPVSADARAGLSLTAAAYYLLKIGSLPILLGERIALPTVGICFAPQYGESYYEIYLGNHAGLVHPAWWGNDFKMRNNLSVTIDFGRTALQLGYEFYRSSMYINYICRNVTTHAFTIGVIPGGLGIKKKKNCGLGEVINPF